MAFETSEAFYAGLSTFSSKVLERAKTNQESFNELYEDAIDAFRDSALDGAGNVEKLKKRYPGGEFDVYKSENRLEDDL